MSRDYKPRRCSARWLDGDCPSEVLAIIDAGPRVLDRYDIFYAEVETVSYGERATRTEHWQTLLCCTESGAYYHNEMQCHEVAAYRYRMKHRYAAWSTLPEAVKAAVRADISSMNEA